MTYLFIYNCEGCYYSEILKDLKQYKELKIIAKKTDNIEIFEINLKKGELNKGRYPTEIGVFLKEKNVVFSKCLCYFLENKEKFKIERVPSFFLVRENGIVSLDGLYRDVNNQYILPEILIKTLKAESSI